MNNMLKDRYDTLCKREEPNTPYEGYEAGWNSHKSYLTSTISSIKEAINILPKNGSINFSVIYKLKRAVEKMGGEADISEFIKAYIQKYTPIRIILNRECTMGYCEESFCMSESNNRVRIWWSGKAYSILGEHTINGIDDSAYNIKDSNRLIFDPTDPMCPVNIDWELWLNDMYNNNKYGSRNANFTIKVFEKEEDDAMFA